MSWLCPPAPDGEHLKMSTIHRFYKVRIETCDGRRAVYYVKARSVAEAARKQAGKGRVVSVEFESQRKV